LPVFGQPEQGIPIGGQRSGRQLGKQIAGRFRFFGAPWVLLQKPRESRIGQGGKIFRRKRLRGGQGGNRDTGWRNAPILQKAQVKRLVDRIGGAIRSRKTTLLAGAVPAAPASSSIASSKSPSRPSAGSGHRARVSSR
jgi:hypothetical protein